LSERVEPDPNRPKVGLVLSGGGARGAYEVGVLRYVREQLPGPTPFHVVTGSSVGAINGAYIAATCNRPRAQVRLLSRVWQEMRLDEVYRFGWDQMRALPTVLFGKNLPRTTTHGSTIGGLVDPRTIEAIVRERIPWRGISDNLYRGNLGAFACSATELTSGTTTIFVQTREKGLPRGPRRRGRSRSPRRSPPRMRWPRRRSRCCSQPCAWAPTCTSTAASDRTRRSGLP
jgi:NTE family protein